MATRASGSGIERTVAGTYGRGALRTALVARLTGLGAAKLRYWHDTVLQPATTRAGSRGVPRLYSWVDYQRLLLIAQLKDRVSVRRIRESITWLDATVPDWYQWSLAVYEGRTASVHGRIHVELVQLDRDLRVLADGNGQTLLANESEALACAVEPALMHMVEAGPLGELREFSDAVQMRPEINAGLPTLINSRLETRFLATAVKSSCVQDVARLYGLHERLLRRALAFQKVAA